MASPSPAAALIAFLGRAEALEELAAAVARVPAAVRARAEVALFVQLGSEPATALEARLGAHPALAGARFLPDPRAYGHGGRRKVVYEYARRQGFARVCVLEPDGRHPPEALAELLAASEAGAELVIAARRGAHLARALQDFVLDLRVEDYASPYRVLACALLARVPFHLNGDGRGFDTELLIQARALGVLPRSVPVAAERDPSYSAAEGLALALGYRAHQLHLTRHGQYLVDHGVRYTRKHHPSSSHAQILAAIRPGSLVLDLGCSQGLLAAPLAERGVRVVGVDVRAPEEVSPALLRYHRRDLEAPLEIPEGRVFDVVVCADVLEHVVRRAELLRGVRRYLKPEGRLLISTPNVAIWFYRLSLLLGRFEYGPRGVLDETHVHLFTRSTFRRAIEGAAFRIVRERVTALPFEVVFESTGKSRAVHALASAYHLLARAWPTLFGYQFLLEAEVRTVLDPPAGP
ncbi:MAG TPA: bifunctional glycosyltransferase/class I SAM-dependent methyltransferase [Planctomycetota bacterium]